VASIQSSPYPLVFPLAPQRADDDAGHGGRIEVRTLARSLEGMQKEALVVACTAHGQTWRMVCDEGPYLNGTDLAPFPLAFFTTGLVDSYLAEIVALAHLRGVRIAALELVQDSFYTMEGSAVRGDMIGGALPVELHVRIGANAAESGLRELVATAVARSPANALMSQALANEFSIAKNGQPVPVGAVRAWAAPLPADLSHRNFDAARPDERTAFPRDIIDKLTAAAPVFDVEGGAGSSLRAEQKRTLHVRGIARQRADGLAETQVQLFKPLGSNFRFLCDFAHRGAPRRAPAPLEYLSAGIAFCFLTQIGRYVAITKHALDRYAVAQQTAFDLAGEPRTTPSAHPVRTHVDIATAADDETVKTIVDMSEQTCFLHAAARSALDTRVRVEVIAA
jgi:uncharacterized OsmC-like protein